MSGEPTEEFDYSDAGMQLTETLEFNWDVDKQVTSASQADIILSTLDDKVTAKIQGVGMSSFLTANFHELSGDDIKSLSVALASLVTLGIPKQYSYIKPLDRTTVVKSVKTMSNGADPKTCLNALVIMEAVSVVDRRLCTREGPLTITGYVIQTGLSPLSGGFPVLDDDLERTMLISFYEDLRSKLAFSNTVVSIQNPLSLSEFETIKKQLKEVNQYSLGKLRALGGSASKSKLAERVAAAMHNLVPKFKGRIALNTVASQLHAAVASAFTTLVSCRLIRSTDNHEAETAEYYYTKGATRNCNLLIWLRHFVKDNNYSVAKNLGNPRWNEPLILAGNEKLTLAIEESGVKGDIVKELDSLVVAGYLAYNKDTRVYSLVENADDILVMVVLSDKPTFIAAFANTILSGKARVLPSPIPHNTHTFLSFSNKPKKHTIDAGSVIYYFRWIATLNIIRTASAQIPSIKFVSDAAALAWSHAPGKAIVVGKGPEAYLESSGPCIYPTRVDILTGDVHGEASKLIQLDFNQITDVIQMEAEYHPPTDVNYNAPPVDHANKKHRVDVESQETF